MSTTAQTVYLSIGSNIDRDYHIRKAIEELQAIDPQLIVSQVFEAEPVGMVADNFYNCVVKLTTLASLASLQQQLKAIEKAYGRERCGKDGHTLDIDILLFGNEVRDCAPRLPRRDIYKFAFVLKPLMELAPELVVPNDGRTIATIWQEFSESQVLWPVSILEC